MVTPWNADNETNEREATERQPGAATSTLPTNPSMQFERMLGLALWAGFAGVLFWIGGAN